MKKHPSDIDLIILNILRGKSKKEEKEWLEEWLQKSPENSKLFEHLRDVWNENTPEVKFINSDELANKIWQKGVGIENQGDNRKFLFIGNNMLKIAVIFLLFLITPFLLYHLLDVREAGNTTLQTKTIEKMNPIGQKTKVHLPDGSIAWLNSGTSIRYNEYFSDSNRIIELVGEAFFEVHRDTLRPFIIKTGDVSTIALGTSFNISAYEENDYIQISLITGKVRVDSDVEEMILHPGNGAYYNKSDNLIRNVEIDEAKILSWKNGILLFDGDDFNAFCNKIQKWYGLNIKVVGEPPAGWRIRGEFKNEYLANILKSISFNKEFQYKINKKEAVFIFN